MIITLSLANKHHENIGREQQESITLTTMQCVDNELVPTFNEILTDWIISFNSGPNLTSLT